MRYRDIVETGDPHNIERGVASFLFMDGKFVPVPYQQHIDVLSKLTGIKLPLLNFDDHGHDINAYYEDRARATAAIAAYAAQHGIVQGSFQPGEQGGPGKSSSATWLVLKGTWRAIRTAYRAFQAAYPEKVAALDTVSYDTLDDSGKRIESGYLEDEQIDRKLGRR